MGPSPSAFQPPRVRAGNLAHLHSPDEMSGTPPRLATLHTLFLIQEGQDRGKGCNASSAGGNELVRSPGSWRREMQEGASSLKPLTSVGKDNSTTSHAHRAPTTYAPGPRNPALSRHSGKKLTMTTCANSACCGPGSGPAAFSIFNLSITQGDNFRCGSMLLRKQNTATLELAL